MQQENSEQNKNSIPSEFWYGQGFYCPECHFAFAYFYEWDHMWYECYWKEYKNGEYEQADNLSIKENDELKCIRCEKTVKVVKRNEN
ncbi:hypothetical protein TTHERM_00083380 (macronuclear) [Tetrahymena thermophila SB210]|uniref:Uncharacterized protein n=1 Tax=Tetrahymena thermophila (strain SB210) TaxID=312017 RepID=Q237B1_TETTS|nr:hypothetical protein TTHERM_00083380 [Tetrahymena thermophila SB210]EAR92339.1 hypothetical protein TTHERM_00083380 [Tetrahymena thermophila SB210]|eukprot:XP_001012584.1 hypothetical protein TTHERM_00083380 [Tetrahymena thermophila SB210]